MLSADFFAAVRGSLFDRKLAQAQVDGLNAISAAWDEFGDGDVRKFAYVLATDLHETAKHMTPITEFGGKNYFRKYDGRRDLGNNQPGDGYRFRGRGYVQITGRKNYTKWAGILGADLVGNPDLALMPEHAGRIAVEGMMVGAFTGKKLGDYIGATKADYQSARKIINGTDRAAMIAGYARKFEAALAA